MAATLHGRHKWSGGRDAEGYRQFTLVNHVKTSSRDDGPFVVMSCAGLPTPGSTWLYGNDNDPWCYCLPTMKVTTYGTKDGHPGRNWLVEQQFTNKPGKRCNDTTIDDPLQEPQKLSGSFVNYIKEIVYDKDGQMVKTSSHELIRGPQVEFDHSRMKVNVSQNVGSLELDVLAAMINTVNYATLWTMAPRCVKLSQASWKRELVGVCSYYYTRDFEFDIDADTFDHDALDEGTKVLHGHWNDNGTVPGWTLDNIGGSAPDADNPTHFDRYKDRNGENCRVILDGTGLPADTHIISGTGSGNSGQPGSIHIAHYQESNFLLLGIPTTF